MAARREISQRKEALLRDLRAAYGDGRLAPGNVAPSVRELARKYELSVGVVNHQLQQLVQEGLFYTVSGAGTYIGQPRAAERKLFLCVQQGDQRDQQMCAGFEDEIVRRGGTALVMTQDQAWELVRGDTRPQLCGVFVCHGSAAVDLLEQLNEHCSQGRLPEVNFVGLAKLNSAADQTGFDDFAGGQQATRHLLHCGHRRIDYLGVHSVDDCHDTRWSVERQRGWQAALEHAEAGGTAYLPRRLATRRVVGCDQLFAEAALRQIHESEATAVVTANDWAALRFIEVCRKAQLPAGRWPSVVSFDDTLPEAGYVLTSLRLPWTELAAGAASLLWERAHGQLNGPPVTRLVAMRMVPRLSCRTQWTAWSNIPSFQTVG